MKVRIIIIPLYIELDERSPGFHDDPRTWDMTALMEAKEGERFFFPEEPIVDAIREV